MSEQGALAALIEGVATRTPDAAALLSADATLSYAELAARSRRYTRWALEQGFAPGAAIGLLASNSPDYAAAWIGLIRAGVAVALLNPQLAPEGLAHALRVVQASSLIVDRSARSLAAEAAAMECDLALWALGGPTSGASDLDAALASRLDDPFAPAETPTIGLHDRALLIFTSGTTGLPKAANVSHARILSWSGWFAGMMDATPQDRLYDCLPMHHSVGGVVAIGAMLAAGGSVVVRERFSASRFWADMRDWRCTIVQYVGELCRHLTAAPPGDDETRHELRLACGNGLRPEVWREFQTRFRIPRILEFYAATEGNFSLFNVEGEPGAIGRIPPFLRHRFPAALVRFDIETGEPARTADGLCIPCARGEVGEALGRIAASDGRISASGRFEGYTDAQASQSKIVRDVEAPGDAWFRTGDLMRQDARGFYYFVDRIGDTFRWKGENVSTTEVERALHGVAGVSDAVVYGVSVAGADGRAGMATLVVNANFDLAEAHAACAHRLAPYARPLFVRVASSIERTETFKPKKAALAAQGFDPSKIADPLFVEDRRLGAYRRLDPPTFAAIMAGEMRL